MRIAAAALGIVMLLAAPPAMALPDGTEVRTYQGGLDFPVDMAWDAPSDRIFFTEKNSGRVMVIEDGRLRGQPCVDLVVEASGERGALGIALHPDFSDNGYLYVFYTSALPLENRVTRFTVRNNTCESPRHVVTGIDASAQGYHNGGQLEFVGSKLFVSTGEAHDPAEAQDTSNRLGKILRINADGSIPANNPFDNAVWSYGHRNPFGLARRPGTDALFETENGPQCDDEMNRIRRGRNYGWGAGYDCGTAGVGEDPKPPLKRWSSVIVPTDPWWYRGRLKALSGSLYVGDFSNGYLHRLVMNERATKVIEDRVIYDSGQGIVDVSKGPGGWLYFLTPNAIMRIVSTR